MHFASTPATSGNHRCSWFAAVGALLCTLCALAASGPAAADETLAATLQTLTESPHATHRKDALDSLAERAALSPLPPEAIAALQKSALSDDYVSNRLLASQILIGQPLGADSKERLGRMWSELLTFPVKDAQAWRNFLHPSSDRQLRPQAVALLAELYESPYPAHAVNAWIHQLRSFGYDESLRLLAQVKAAAGFTDEQRSVAASVAYRMTLPQRREVIYRLFARKLDATQLEDTVATMQAAREAAARPLAAMELLLYFEDSRVPLEISDAALSALKQSGDRILQVATARLVAAGAESIAARELKLIDAMRSGQYDNELPQIFLALHGPDETAALINRLLPDTGTPLGLRMALLAQLAEQAKTGRAFDANVTDALEQAAHNTDSYVEISQIRRAYDAMQTDPPWVVWLKSRQTQSAAVGVVFLALVVINGLAGLASFTVILLREPAAGAGPASRVVRFLVWLALSVVMLALMGWAFLGFIGHNSAPPPATSLRMNIPLYIGTIAYLPFIWLLSRRTGD